MKTKAYKLAAELGLQERAVLDWLRSHGYPNVRRADTIRADVARRAREALRRPGGGPSPRRSQRGRSNGHTQTGTVGGGQKSQKLSVSFAELLESHLPGATAEIKSTRDGMPVARMPRGEQPTVPISPPVPTASSDFEALKRKIQQAERDRDQARRDAAELRIALEAARREVVVLSDAHTRAETLKETLEMARIDLERAQVEATAAKQALRGVEDERSMLEDTCGELQQELASTREALQTAETEQDESESMLTSLEEAMQREVAWRTRALELERNAQIGANLAGILQGLGVVEARDQAMALRALLSERQTALPFLRAIRQVDADVLARLLEGKLQRVCAHPVCNYVAKASGRVVLRVDADEACEICRGSDEQRWFARMVRESSRSGARRLLIVGADDAHEALRTLSQGEPVSLRLVSSDEEVHAHRARGRVDGCDVLVVWSEAVTPPEISKAYAAAAREEGRPVVSVLGQSPSIVSMAQAICNRLARANILLPG